MEQTTLLGKEFISFLFMIVDRSLLDFFFVLDKLSDELCDFLYLLRFDDRLVDYDDAFLWSLHGSKKMNNIFGFANNTGKS